MKKTLNILSTVDLSVLALWLISFIVARLTAETSVSNPISAAFVIIYALAIVTVLVFTIVSVILLVKKKEYSLPLLIFTYVMNFAWIAVLIALIRHIIDMSSTLL